MATRSTTDPKMKGLTSLLCITCVLSENHSPVSDWAVAYVSCLTCPFRPTLDLKLVRTWSLVPTRLIPTDRQARSSLHTGVSLAVGAEIK